MLLQEPVLVVLAFYLLFVLVIIYVRLDFSITKVSLLDTGGWGKAPGSATILTYYQVQAKFLVFSTPAAVLNRCTQSFYGKQIE